MDDDPLQIKDANYAKPLECLMVEVTESPDLTMEVSELEYSKKVKEVYPHIEEELTDFRNRCKFKDSEVLLFLRCMMSAKLL